MKTKMGSSGFISFKSGFRLKEVKSPLLGGTSFGHQGKSPNSFGVPYMPNEFGSYGFLSNHRNIPLKPDDFPVDKKHFCHIGKHA